MKKLLLILFAVGILTGRTWSQCVTTCSNYAVLAIPFALQSSAGTNAIPQLVPNTDDGITPLVNIGFSFNFYCTTYTQVWICSNGFIQFNNGAPAVSTGYADPTQQFPSVVAPNAMVALDMNDLDAGSGSSAITYATLGTAPNRMFVVTYSNVPIFGYSTSLHSGQIVLYETSNIIDIYTAEVTNLSTTNGTQGIEDPTGTLATTVPGRNNVMWNSLNTAYRFVPATPVPPPSILGGTTTCQGTQNFFTSLTANGATSYTWALPAGWTGTSSTTALTATAGASGNVSVAATYTCGTSAATTIFVNVDPAPLVTIQAVNPALVCEGTTFTITASGAPSYTVYPNQISGPSPLVIQNNGISTYSVVGSTGNGCLSVNVATTQIVSQTTPTVTVNSGSICLGENFTMLPSGAVSYVVSGGFLSVNPSTVGVYNYSVTGIGGNNCPSLLPAISTLTVNSNPVVDITTPRTTICKNETITLTATGASSYSWSNNQNTTTISVAPVGIGMYSVTGTSPEGCSGTQLITIIVSDCVGIDEIANTSGGIVVYPNPANGTFYVKFENTGVKELEVYNSLGQVVQHQKTDQLNAEINITIQPNGVYYLKLKGSEQMVLKIIKE